MIWMKMPGQTWLDATAMFVAMWTAMMAAMMLPSLLPTLWQYRRVAVAANTKYSNAFVALIGIAYFLVWTLVGAALFPFGVALANIEMQSAIFARNVPFVAGAVVVIAGVLQFTTWKSQRLNCCRVPLRQQLAPISTAGDAWRRGIHLGIHCVYGCANLTAIMLAVGIMDSTAMIAVTIAITAERLLPTRYRSAEIVGALAIVIGALSIAQTLAAACVT